MGRPDYAKRSLDDVVGRLRGKKLDLLIVILPDVNGSLYGNELWIAKYLLLQFCEQYIVYTICGYKSVLMFIR